jgi:ribose transport system substrate-binding protein
MQDKRYKRRAGLRALGMGVAGFAAVAAIGVADAASAGATDASATTAAASSFTYDHAYKGADRKYFRVLPQPKIKKGVKFKVGYLQIDSSTHTLNVEQEGSATEAKLLGGSEQMLNSADNAQTQVSQFNQLLTEKVNAVVGYPLVPGGLLAGVKLATKSKIPAVFIGTVTNSAAGLPAGSPFDVDQAIDYSVYETMKTVAGELPKGSSFAILGFGLPVPALVYQQERQKYWGEKFGLKFDGEQNATAGTPAAYSTAASQILTQHPNVSVVLTMNDDAALATATATRNTGRTKVKVATSNGGDPELIPLIKSGVVIADCVVPWAEEGKQATIAAYDELTKQDLPLPKFIQIPPTIVTKANVNKVEFAQ